MSSDVQLRVSRGDAASGQLVSYIVPAEEGEVVLGRTCVILLGDERP